MLRVHQNRVCVVVLALIALSLPATVRGGEGVPCEQTQAAIDLRSCGHCRELKRILSEPGLSGVSFIVTPLRLGATVHIVAPDEDGRLLVQDLVEQMWGEGAGHLDDHSCEFCRARQEKLAKMLVDWSATDDGTEIVLISEDRGLAQWALQDARSTQGWVLSSASD